MEPITVTIADARKALGLGNTSVYSLISEGRLQTVKYGRRTLVKADSIREFVSSLEAA